MKIATKDEVISTVLFLSLCGGQVFKFGSNYFLKLNRLDSGMNAIWAESGNPCYFPDNSKVVKVEGKFVVDRIG